MLSGLKKPFPVEKDQPQAGGLLLPTSVGHLQSKVQRERSRNQSGFHVWIWHPINLHLTKLVAVDLGGDDHRQCNYAVSVSTGASSK